ncbi:MAG: hypothetical protein U0838_09865 [Chloroflexota bacterium]
MRITEGTLAFSASHAVQATLEGHHSVTQWAGGDQTQQSQDVKITVSGAEASAHLRTLAAGQRAYQATAAASSAHVRAMARRSSSHAVHPVAIAPGQISANLAPRAASSAHQLTATDQLWLMLVQITGGTQAAADLADRLAKYAQAAAPGSGVADAFAAVAQAHPTAEAQAAQPDWGYREEGSVTVTETEQTSFAAAGSVKTADGRQITVAEAFNLVRSTQSGESFSIRAGAALHDPLVLQTGVGAPMTGSGMQAVDVNNDGTAEQVAALAPGSAYLVRDLNGNGLVDGGAELFGPATDNGFGELSAVDNDQNGWVDEADAVWGQLGLWTGEAGAAITKLGEAGVGAISTGSAATPFSFGEAGQLSAAGVYLHENGQAGIVGEINLYA